MWPQIAPQDLARVADIITRLYDPATSSQPALAKQLQHDLQQVQTATEAWGLIPGLAAHDDANVRFFSAHTAQVKISRDWDSLPTELHAALLQLLLETLANALSPMNPNSYQAGNTVVVRKLFGSLASLLLRLPFHLFPNPITTVLQTIESSTASSTQLPPSVPPSGYNTPGLDVGRLRHKLRLWSLEWCGICVEEIARAGISQQKRHALQRHIDTELPAVMATITDAMRIDAFGGPDLQADSLKEAEAACRCAESWVGFGLDGDQLIALLPVLYSLLPLPAASSAVTEILSESVFKYGKGTKSLTEPLVEWVNGPGQAVFGAHEPSDEVIAATKMLCELVEHSSEWIVARITQADVQSFLGTILRITGWQGVGGVDENVSELTLPIYPLLQEAVMDSSVFSTPHDTAPEWQVVKGFFKQLVHVVRSKVRFPEGHLDREDREAYDVWRRDAGEVIVGAYYILRDDMLGELVQTARQQAQGPWQDVEATLHCIRYSAEAVPLGEDVHLPVLFGEVLTLLAHRDDERLRLTVVSLIQAYEEWFKYHPDHLLPVLGYLVPSLTSTHAISRSAADALKALCDMCRKKLVDHIGAFSELHGKIGDLGPEEQVKVIQGITSVIQALQPTDAVGPVTGILTPIVDRLDASTEPALLVQNMNALVACFKGLSPSEDDIFEENTNAEDVALARPLVQNLRQRIEQSITNVVAVWNGDGEVADAISSLVKSSTSADTLISLSPLPLLSLVCLAAERSPSALWMALASTLTLRINNPPSPLTVKRDKTPAEAAQHEAEEQERWGVVANAATRLVVVANHLLAGTGMRDHPDVVESWFRFCSALSTRFPGVLLRLDSSAIEIYMSLGVGGLSAQERFSLTTTCGFFIALFANTRYPSPLEPHADTLLKHFGPQILRALLLSAGSEGPRSVIPNLAELLASLATRVKGPDMNAWLDAILFQDGFPDPRATGESKTRLKEVILRSRTSKKMREALHEFALVARGLANTTYGNATAV